MSQIPKTVGIDIGKNSFHVVGHDERGAIVLRQKWSRGQLEARFANMPPCLVGTEACVGAHHLSRKLKALGHDARLMPEISMHKDGKQVVETAVEARGGLLGRPVLLVLLVSCFLAVAALIVTYSGA